MHPHREILHPILHFHRETEAPPQTATLRLSPQFYTKSVVCLFSFLFVDCPCQGWLVLQWTRGAAPPIANPFGAFRSPKLGNQGRCEGIAPPIVNRVATSYWVGGRAHHSLRETPPAHQTDRAIAKFFAPPKSDWSNSLWTLAFSNAFAKLKIASRAHRWAGAQAPRRTCAHAPWGHTP